MLSLTGAGATTISGQISGTGGLTFSGLTSSGTGSLALNGKNTYQGGTSINSGTVTVGSNGSLGSGSLFVGNPGAVLNLNNSTQTVGGLSGDSSATINLAPNGNLTVLTNGGGYSGVITGPGASLTLLAGSGSPDLTLYGNNTYSGGTMIGSGVLLEVGTINAALGTGSITIQGGSLEVSGAISNNILLLGSGKVVGTFSGVISDSAGAGSLIILGTTVLTNTGNSYSGGTTIGTTSGAATLSVNSDANLGTGPVSIVYGTLQITGNSFISSKAVMLGGSIIYVVTNTATLTGVLSGFPGPGSLLKTGNGTLILTNSGNTYSGGTSIYGGTLSVSSDNNLGTGNLTLNGGVLQITGSSAFSSSKNVALANGSTINVTNSAGATLSGQLSDLTTLGSLVITGGGSVVLSNNGNTYGGGTTIDGGVLSVSTDSCLGTGATVSVNGGTLLYTASSTTNRTFNLNSGAIEAASGATITYTGTVIGGFLQGAGIHQLAAGSSLIGTTTFASATINQTGSATLTNYTNGGLFTNGAGLTWSGGLNQSSGRVTVNNILTASNWSSKGILTVATTGTLNEIDSSLSLGGGSQTYVGSSTSPNTGGTIAMTTGSTIELNGGLLVNNGTIGTAGAGLVDINYGSLAKGAGNYAGGYSVNLGGKFQPGNSPGLVVSGSAVWNGGGSFSFQINNATGSGGTNWGVNNITGSLTIAATSTSPFGISVQSLTGGNAAGQIGNFDPTQSYQWVFINASGGITGFSPATIALNTSGFANSFTGVFTVSENSGATSLYLSYTPATVSGTVRWSGAVSNAWDINTTQNWTAGGSPTTYLQSANGGQAVVFDDTATGNFNVNLTSALSPSSMTVNNSINTYTFSGTGKITGSASLLKTGTGTLIVTTANDYAGGTTISGGTLQIGDGTNSGALPGYTTNNASLVFMPGASGITVAGSIGGNGTVTILGTNVVTFTGTNSYAGGTTITGGTLNINSDIALGAAAGAVKLNGGTLQFAATGGITLNSSRNVVLGGGAFDTNGGNDTINGVVSGTDPVKSNLVKNGQDALTLTNTNTYTGSTTVNAGGLVVGSTATLGSGPLLVNNTNPAPSSTDVYLYNTAGQTVGNLSSNLTGAASGNTVGIFLGAGVTLTVNQTAPGTFQGTIFGSGSLVLGSVSISTLTLIGNSTYGGGTTINGGTLQLGVANALPATTPLTLGSGGTLNLFNNNQTIAALNSSAGNINTGTGTGGILTIGNTAGGTVTYSGVISGTGGLTWGIVNTNVANPTPSTLLLTNTSTNTGPMTINSGTLSIGTAYALSGGAAPVLPYSASNTYPGAFTLGPTATLLTNGFNLTIGSLGGGGPIGGNINLGNNSNSTLYIGQSLVQTASTGYAGVISGTGNVYIVNGVNLAVYGNWTLTGGVTHDVTTLGANHNDSPQSYLLFANSGSAVTTQGINFAGFTDQVSTIYGGSAGDNNGKGTFVDATGDGGKLVLSYYAATVANGGPANGSGGTQNFSGFFANDVGLIFDAGYFGNAQHLTLSGPNNTSGPLTIGFTNQTTPQNGAATGAQSGVMNQVIISATSTFGAVTVGSIAVSNLVNNLTVVAGTGNLTAASVTIGDAFPGSTGNNSVTVGGTLTAGSVSIGNTSLYGTNVLTILSTGTVKASGAITIGNDFATGTGTLNVNGALGTTSTPVTSLSIQAGGVLAGDGTINTATNPINVTNGTIRGGFDDGVNQLGTLTIAASSGTTAKAVLTIQGSGSSGLGQTGALMTEVLATSSTAATNSKINITGANNALSLNTTSGGSGQINIVLYDPTASLTPGGPGGATYTFVLATVATAGRIQLGGANQPAGTTIDTGTTLGAGSGASGNADLFIQGPSPTYMNAVTSWSLFIDSTGRNLELSVTSAAPEPEHVLLLCAAALFGGFAIRRQRRRSVPVAAV